MADGLCPYPGCDYDAAAHRPYARKRDGIPSVTTISGMVDTGKARSFAWAATTIAARAAVHNAQQWAGLRTVPCDHDARDYCQACRYLRSEHDRHWRAKANIGTHVHHLAAQWAAGEDVAEDDTTAGYLNALEQFYRDTRPTWHLVEFTVGHNQPNLEYRGQGDIVASLTRDGTRRRGMWDIKTGGFHAVEQTLQLAAYRYARQLTRWEGGRSAEVGPVPPVDEAGVLMLSADGGYELIALPAERAAHQVFLELRRVWGWVRQVEQWEKERKQ